MEMKALSSLWVVTGKLLVFTRSHISDETLQHVCLRTNMPDLREPIQKRNEHRNFAETLSSLPNRRLADWIK